MVYGNQWDEIMSWLIATESKTDYQININSSEWGNYVDSTGEAKEYSGELQTSGKKANNIYDLAGNYLELTQEFKEISCIRRGGYYGGNGTVYPASDRNMRYPDGTALFHTSRPALYIK